MPARGGGWMNLPAVVFAKPNAEVQDRAHRNWSRSKQSNFAARCSDQTLKWNHWDQRRCHLLFLSTCLQTLKNSHQWMASLIFGSEECLRPSRKSMKLCRNEHDKCSTRTHTKKEQPNLERMRALHDCKCGRWCGRWCDRQCIWQCDVNCSVTFLGMCHDHWKITINA